MTILPVQLLFHSHHFGYWMVSLCFGSFPCCIGPIPVPNTDSNKFLCKISQIHLSCGVLVDQNKISLDLMMMSYSPNTLHFLLLVVFNGGNCASGICGLRQKPVTLPSEPNKLNLLSSVHSTWSQKHRGCSRYAIRFIRLVFSLSWNTALQSTFV